MPLDELTTVCPPPAKPVNVPSASDWQALEAHVGHALPSDYRAFIDRYGSGAFGSNEPGGGFFDLVFVLSCGQPPDRHDLNAVPLMMELTKTIGEIGRRWPAMVPAPAWPEPGGLLYVGGTTTTHCIYWKTTGEADAWTCAVSDRGCDNWFEWNGDLTSLLTAIAQKRVPDWIVEGPSRFPLVFVALDVLDAAPLV